MEAYLQIVRKVLESGVWKDNRTGVRTLAIAGAMLEHDMTDGYPLVITKKVPFRVMAVELEGFIRGVTDKRWYQERGCHIWDDWCNPEKEPYGHDEESRLKMAAQHDLGPIYGYQWRHFGGPYRYGARSDSSLCELPKNHGFDQLSSLVSMLKTNPNDRRMIVSAWNPLDLPLMALPPCHWGFQVTVIDGRLNLLWNQRSVDTALGLPFNIASYGLLLHLLAREASLGEGKLIGFLGDVHVYDNHIAGLEQQLERAPRPLPKLVTEDCTFFDRRHEMTRVEGYDPHPKIKFEVAI